MHGRRRKVVPGIWIELPALTTAWAPKKAPPTVGCLGQQLEMVDPSLREVIEGGGRRALLTITKAQVSLQADYRRNRQELSSALSSTCQCSPTGLR